MINEKIVPMSPYGFRVPTEIEMAVDETLKLCGISGEDASMIAIEVMKKLGQSNEMRVFGSSRLRRFTICHINPRSCYFSSFEIDWNVVGSLAEATEAWNRRVTDG